MANHFTPPRLSMPVYWAIGFGAFVMFFTMGAAIAHDPIIRAACVLFVAAFSFQFWTVATSRGERELAQERTTEKAEADAMPTTVMPPAE